jgi:hypothetical protein
MPDEICEPISPPLSRGVYGLGRRPRDNSSRSAIGFRPEMWYADRAVCRRDNQLISKRREYRIALRYPLLKLVPIAASGFRD